MSTLRLRRKPFTEVVRNFDAFPKVSDSVGEDKKAFGGAVSIVCWIVIVWLVISELLYYSETHFLYKFSVDVDYDTKLQIDMDFIIATPCDLIGADVMDATNQPVPFSYNQLRMDPVHFEMSPHQRRYFEMLQMLHKQQAMQLQSLDHLLFMTKGVLDEIHKPDETFAGKRFDACRVHGFVRVNKVAGNFHVSPGKSLPLEGGHAHISFFGSGIANNFSHRITKFSFGPRLFGLINPLDGVEKISKNNMDLFQYYVQVVPTKVHTSHGENVDTCQYSMTQRSRTVDHDSGSHGTPGLFIKYDLSSVMVDVRETHRSYVELMVRLCAIIGGVFATFGFMNSVISSAFDSIFCCCNKKSKKFEPNQIGNYQNGVAQKPTTSLSFETDSSSSFVT